MPNPNVQMHTLFGVLGALTPETYGFCFLVLYQEEYWPERGGCARGDGGSPVPLPRPGERRDVFSFTPKVGLSLVSSGKANGSHFSCSKRR